MNGLLLTALVSFAAVCFVGVRIRTLLTYFQQDEYDSSRLWGTMVRVRLFDIKASAFILIAFALDSSFARDELMVLLIAIILLLIAWLEQKRKFKKSLVFTERAKRIFLLANAIAVPFVLLTVYFNPYYLLLLFQLIPIAVVLSNRLLSPVQRRINQKYVQLAQEKLARMNPTRIGITGSFGKTTVKHIFAEILSGSGPVLYSPGSVNTVLGMTRHIRRRLQWSHRYFIAEMGAYGIGSIDRLCNFAKPHFGIVTSVGAAHIERFGSTDVIAKAKSELVEYVCSHGGHAVINSQVLEFQPFQDLKLSYPDAITVVGHSDTDDVQILRSQFEAGHWTIRLGLNSQERQELEFVVPLAGEHNVLNAALAVAMCLIIDPEALKNIGSLTKGIQQIPHRLQLRETKGQPLILDDSFNSNETGFKNAVGVLGKLATERGGKSILVTPGIAELGVEHDAAHNRLGEYVKDICDVIIVVNPNRIPSFVAPLKRSGAQVFEVPTLADARSRLVEFADEQDVILYENDLPDLLEERRLL